MKRLTILTLAVLLSFSPVAMARDHHSSGSHRSATHSSHHHSNYADGVKRDSHGKIARSQSAKNQFKKSQPCPSSGKSSGPCKGYVIDHVKPLKRGGEDKPSNMQWQSTAAAKEKDKTE